MIREATANDVPALYDLVIELARYEHLEHERTGTADQLVEHLFGARRYAEALVAAEPDETTDGERVVGFALFFHTYSTFLTRPGIWLEDLFVRAPYRRRGHARALLGDLARLAQDRGCGRVEWSVLAWNEPAIAFYRSLGAPPLEDWRTCRLTGDALAELARKPRTGP